LPLYNFNNNHSWGLDEINLWLCSDENVAMMKQTSHAYKIPLKDICLAVQGEDGRTTSQCENMRWMTLARECDQW